MKVRYIPLLLFTLIAVSCSTPDGRFRLEGQFKSFNQGELYIYSLDQGRARLDTIQLFDGKFAYDIAVDDTAAYSVIFPNFSEIPVFAEPGATVKMQGDASHLKAVSVTGTDLNDLMTSFRLSLNDQTPPQVLKSVAAFVREHPTSPASLLLVNKHFVQRVDPDYRQAFQLVDVMLRASPTDDRLRAYRQQLQQLQASVVGSRLPTFAAVTTRGQRVSNADLRSRLNIVYVWASWNFETLNMQRQLRSLQRDYPGRLSLVGICLDASLKDCRDVLSRDSVTWPVVCDGKMWQSPVLSQLGISEIPCNLLLDNTGKIIDRNLSTGALREKIKTTLQ